MNAALKDKGESSTPPERLVLAILRRRPTMATGLQKLGIAVGAIFEGRVPESFKAFHYGGFDDDVAEALESLREEGYVQGGHGATFELTAEGRELVDNYLTDLDARRLRDVADTVTQAFKGANDDQVIAVVYDMFPELTVDSLIKEKVARTPRPPNVKVIAMKH